MLPELQLDLLLSRSNVLDELESLCELASESEEDLSLKSEESDDIDFFERLFLCLDFLCLDLPRLRLSSPFMLWMVLPPGALSF